MDIGTIVAGLLTLAVLTFLYRDNPVYTMAEYLMISVSVGFELVINWSNTLMDRIFNPLFLQGQWHSRTGSQKMVPMVPDPKGPGKEIMDLYQAYLDAGELKPVLDRSYTLAEVPEAFRYYGTGHARGHLFE